MTRRLQRWRDAGHEGVRISVNLCGQQLSDAASVDRMAALLQASGLPCGSVELEITESTLVTPTPDVLAHMDRLRRVGFGLAIDDFGIGFSALSCLEEFPLTTLKVDRSFVGKLARPGHNDAVTRSIIAIGRALGLEVVAEGVETQEQRDMLIQLGCEVMQGYLYSAALTEDEAVRWLRRLAPVRANDDGVVLV